MDTATFLLDVTTTTKLGDANGIRWVTINVGFTITRTDATGLLNQAETHAGEEHVYTDSMHDARPSSLVSAACLSMYATTAGIRLADSCATIHRPCFFEVEEIIARARRRAILDLRALSGVVA